MSLTLRQKSLQALGDRLHKTIVDGFESGKKLAIVKAPPGSGKTFMLLRIIATMIENNARVAIATQTNTQADDLIRQAVEHPIISNFAISRLAASGANSPDNFPPSAFWVQRPTEVPEVPGLVIATAAKWATVKDNPGFDLFAVDEAWQMKWADMMRCSAVSERYLLIGDPGQIPPVTSVDVSRWGTSQRPPHKAVPEVVLEKFSELAITGSLPAVRRLPMAAVEYVKPFYDFDFEAFAEVSDRSMSFSAKLVEDSELAPNSTESNIGYLSGSANFDEPVIRVLEKLENYEPVLATLPTPEDGPPAETDLEVALGIKRIVKALLTLDFKISLDGKVQQRRVMQKDIGITASHRAMNGLLRKTLGNDYSEVRIDTPERWQGLEKPFMIAVHPLSGAQEPSDFDLGTGRLCVMASRQQIGLIFVSRDHISETLANTVTFATQPPGQPDDIGRGREAHVNLVSLLSSRDRIISLI